MKINLIRQKDSAHELLLPFIMETESLLQEALESIDKNAQCRILPAVDLGFPHDVIRIAGGFPTGCYVEWNANVPFVPVDTTVNIDTSSIFELDEDISDGITEIDFDRLKSNFDKSSYLFNFHKGNHFISFGRYEKTGKPVLVIHSNEKEFKYQFNGLMPSDDNWYHNDVSVIYRGNRYLRYLVGRSADLFIDIAKSLEDFNVIRHRFVAHLLTNGKTNINKQEDHHHYYMPSRQSVAIGCFPVNIDNVVPIFSRPGKKISMFKVGAGGNNVISNNEKLVLVPHGWGKTCHDGTSFSIDFASRKFNLSGKDYEIKTLVSLGKDERLELRDFDDGIDSENSLFHLMNHHCPGRVIDQIKQVVSYTKYGFLRHV